MVTVHRTSGPPHSQQHRTINCTESLCGHLRHPVKSTASANGPRIRAVSLPEMRRLLIFLGFCSVVTCTPVIAQNDTHRLQQKVDDLTATVKALQAEVRKLEAERGDQTSSSSSPLPFQDRQRGGFTPVTGAASIVASNSSQQQPSMLDVAQAPRSLLPLQQNISGNVEASPRIDNQAPPTNPDLKGFVQIPGTQTIIRLGGYAKVDMIYDTGDIGTQDLFVASSIRVPQPADDGSNFNMHARQTRFTFEVRRPTVLGQSMRFYFENDFLSGANGQYQFHLRQAYGQLGNTYAGYGFTAFEDADAIPETLDFEGPVSVVSAYQPAIHQSFHLGHGKSLTLSVEKPTSEVSTVEKKYVKGLQGAQHLPDLVLAARTEHGWGHLQLGTVLRQLAYINGEHNGRSLGYGASLSGAIKTTGSSSYADRMMFGVVQGKGIAHYINDTGGLGLDAVVDKDGLLHPLKALGAYAGYTHYWSNSWRSTLVYGVTRIQASPWLGTTMFRESRYGAANLIWNPAPTLAVGLEILHGRLLEQDNRFNDDTRIQGSLQYSFVK